MLSVPELAELTKCNKTTIRMILSRSEFRKYEKKLSMGLSYRLCSGFLEALKVISNFKPGVLDLSEIERLIKNGTK